MDEVRDTGWIALDAGPGFGGRRSLRGAAWRRVPLPVAGGMAALGGPGFTVAHGREAPVPRRGFHEATTDRRQVERGGGRGREETRRPDWCVSGVCGRRCGRARRQRIRLPPVRHAPD
jgi:hypothetical protein